MAVGFMEARRIRRLAELGVRSFTCFTGTKLQTLTQKALQFKREKEQGQFGHVKNEKSKEDAQKEKESAKHVNKEASRDEVHKEKKEAGKQMKKEATRDDVAQKAKKDPGKQKKNT